jgi:hypothetical protein
MKRYLVVAGLAAAMIVVAPTPARAATVDPEAFHGHTADAVFNSTNGGVQTDADVVLTVGRATSAAAGGVAVPVSVLAVELTVSGGTEDLHAYGTAFLEPSEFTFDEATLTAASVHKTLQLGREDGTTMTVEVDVHWTGWGRYDSGRNGGFVVPGQYVLNVTTKNREFMSATGSVLEGSTNYTPEDTSGGYVQQVNYNSKLFTH